MEKTATLNLRVNPEVKQQAEHVLKQLGVPMATAVDMFLRQVSMTGGIPFEVSLPKAPPELNLDLMTKDQFLDALAIGFEDAANGNIQDAATAFAAHRAKRS